MISLSCTSTGAGCCPTNPTCRLSKFCTVYTSAISAINSPHHSLLSAVTTTPSNPRGTPATAPGTGLTSRPGPRDRPTWPRWPWRRRRGLAGPAAVAPRRRWVTAAPSTTRCTRRGTRPPTCTCWWCWPASPSSSTRGGERTPGQGRTEAPSGPPRGGATPLTAVPPPRRNKRKIMRIFTLPPAAETPPEPNFYDSVKKIRLRQQLEMYSIGKSEGRGGSPGPAGYWGRS